MPVTAIEVVRAGRFNYQVILRIPDGFDMELNRPFWFRRTAVRYARRKAAEEFGAKKESDLILRLTP